LVAVTLRILRLIDLGCMAVCRPERPPFGVGRIGESRAH
jgi:hypothetical protein